MIEQSERRVLVVGGGIIGASIAWHVMQSGAQVTIVDAAEPGGVATPCSFGWVNATHGNPKPYFDLRVASMQAWREWKSDVPGLAVRETGTVYLHLDGHDGTPVDLNAFAAGHAAWGYDIEPIGGNAVAIRAPNVRDLPETGLWAPCEGAAEGDEIARFLVEDCVSNGATLLTGTRVEGLISGECQVTGVVTGAGPITADEVVVAAGAATSDIVSGTVAAIPMTTPQGILIHTEPCAPLIPHITLTKDLHVRQREDGSILAGWDFGGGAGPSDPEDAAAALIEKIRQTFVGADDVKLANVTIGYRPTPADGFPVVGRPEGLPGLTVAVMHSGITLAPIVGRAVSALLAGGELSPLFAPFGPDRFQTS